MGMARGLLTLRPTMVDSDILVMEDTMARGLLTPRPTMVESDTLVMLDTEDTMARGLLILRPTTVDSAMPDMVGMAMVLDTDTLDKFQIRKYCGELQTLI